jgi:hypothetical protein
VCAGAVAEFLLMFWLHVWLLAYDPEALEPLPGNAVYKDEAQLTFLNDLLGAGRPAALAATGALQVALCLLLVRYWAKRPAEPGGQEEAGEEDKGRGANRPALR